MLSEVESWSLELDDDSFDQVSAAIDKLAEDGPTLGRPLVDRISGWQHHNVTEVDPQRRAELLVVGDKLGSWSSWLTRRECRMIVRKW